MEEFACSLCQKDYHYLVWRARFANKTVEPSTSASLNRFDGQPLQPLLRASPEAKFDDGRNEQSGHWLCTRRSNLLRGYFSCSFCYCCLSKVSWRRLASCFVGVLACAPAWQGNTSGRVDRADGNVCKVMPSKWALAEAISLEALSLSGRAVLSCPRRGIAINATQWAHMHTSHDQQRHHSDDSMNPSSTELLSKQVYSPKTTFVLFFSFIFFSSFPAHSDSLYIYRTH